MSKLFRRGKGASDHDDEMTISSGWSVGGSSVSDRIMGRMKKNLSAFGGSGSSSRSVVSSSSSIGGGSRMSFGSRRAQNSRTMGNRGDGRSRPAGKMRGNDDADPSSMVFSGAAGLMDMQEQNAMMGKRARPSTPSLRPGPYVGHGSARSLASKPLYSAHSSSDFEPMEYSLTELRSMSEADLEQTMLDAGVTREEITKSIDEAIAMDASIDTVAEEQKKNLLVALFVNSGRVKLVRHDARKSGRPSLQFSMSNRSLGSTKSNNDERRSTVSSFTRPSTVSEMDMSMNSLNMSTATFNDAASVGGASVKSSSSSKNRKSKLEKILQLQTENKQVKRENKSLKKTVKKLLGQLLEAEKKEALSKKKHEEEIDLSIKDIDDGENAKPAGTDDRGNTKPSDEVEGTENEDDDEVSVGDVSVKKSSPKCGSLDCSVDTKSLLEDDTVVSESATSRRSVRNKRRSLDCEGDAKNDNKNKTISVLKRKLKKEREAHKNTEFRMKAEIEILTTEVAGLQRELASSLESMEDYEKRVREARETVSNLKHKLKHTTTKVNQLREEAEARDRLIETFSRILLQKAGVEGEFEGSLDGSGPGSSAGEEKIAEFLDVENLKIGRVKSS